MTNQMTIQQTTRGDYMVRDHRNHERGRFRTLPEAEAKCGDAPYEIRLRDAATISLEPNRFYLHATGFVWGEESNIALGHVTGDINTIDPIRINALARSAGCETAIEALFLIERTWNGVEWVDVARHELPELVAVAFIGEIHPDKMYGNINYGRSCSLWKQGKCVARFTRWFRYDGRDDTAIQSQIDQWAAKNPGMLTDAHISWRRKIEGVK